MNRKPRNMPLAKAKALAVVYSAWLSAVHEGDKSRNDWLALIIHGKTLAEFEDQYDIRLVDAQNTRALCAVAEIKLQKLDEPEAA